eukprot:Phypoly_transcript_23628.p1 GENE.Phypoly_transcript_23628~~Phypoly_transcript_23628.p1  ORF type:complete len:129 (+),score=18.10 Phypoly_transcript_23628:176-562(+)
MDALGLLHTFASGGEERIIAYVNTFTGDILIVGYAPNESKANYGSKLNAHQAYLQEEQSFYLAQGVNDPRVIAPAVMTTLVTVRGHFIIPPPLPPAAIIKPPPVAPKPPAAKRAPYNPKDDSLYSAYT